MVRQKIMMVDDNTVLCSIYSSLLVEEGYQVMTVTDPVDVIQRGREFQPDLILLDIMMKPFDGWEVLERIRDDKFLSSAAIVMLSGKVVMIDEVLKYGMKIDGFIKKPIKTQNLLSYLHDFFIRNQSFISRSESLFLSDSQTSIRKEYVNIRRQIHSLNELLQILRSEYHQMNESEFSALLGESFSQIESLISELVFRRDEIENQNN